MWERGENIVFNVTADESVGTEGNGFERGGSEGTAADSNSINFGNGTCNAKGGAGELLFNKRDKLCGGKWRAELTDASERKR